MTMQSVVRSLRVLDAVAAHQPVGVAELARLLEVPKSSVQRSLTTLADTDWIEPVVGEATRWALGPAARQLARNNTREVHLREAALGPMQRLRDETDETIHLAVPEGLRSVALIERMDSNQAVRTFNELGTRTPIHATSTGLAILAHSHTGRIDALLAGNLEMYSSTSIVEAGELRAELERIRKRGYSVNVRMYRPQVAAVGAAILDRRAEPVAGICISMPDSRFHRKYVPHWGELVAKTASEIGTKL